jgi:hypothetical protein
MVKRGPLRENAQFDIGKVVLYDRENTERIFADIQATDKEITEDKTPKAKRESELD